ncbi:MAG: polysaccharide deacetylase family protein [Bacteroidales bacterium]|nr:polysaccharide deacetylase family protein [Bacteroidales bacterium]
MFFVRTPVLLMKIFPELIWRLKGQQREDDDCVYLTFDDGPTPGVTTWVLDQLRQYDAKGTFFCLGKNVEKHPGLYRQIIDEGHSVGNHTYSHLKGWQTDNTEYYNDIQLANNLMSSTLFRPPYGSLRTSQIKYISEEYNIVMWDVLSQDYSQTIAPQKVLSNVLSSVKGGSIVVFHDSLKAQPNLSYTLPRMLKELHGKYEFRKIV